MPSALPDQPSALTGLMMDSPLSITSIMRHAEQCHGEREIVSLTADGALHRHSYQRIFARARRLANALGALGVAPGDRVGTLAWNDHRHLEAYYAVSCSGAILHTVNPRLFAEQIAYIINHAQDVCLLADPLCLPLLDELAEKLATVRHIVVLDDALDVPARLRPLALCYEDLLAEAAADYSWPELDENTASAICYTSGTTGHPKGVVYSHRSTVLHAYAAALPDVLSLATRDAVLPVVPMFHVNAWGVPYAVPLVGAKLVLPGPQAGDAATLTRLIDAEQVSCALGVPTVWLGLLDHLAATGTRVASLNRILVGGAACPARVIEEFRDRHDVVVHHGWGMTETSPLGTYNTLKPGMNDLPAEQKLARQLTQGRAIFGVELKIVADDGQVLPWDGETVGELCIRGPWVASEYYRPDETIESHDREGWFRTGDVASIDPDGFLTITDRIKDLIKSGGEWISSIELENIAVSHPGVAEAAVVGVPHPKWTERPLLIVVPRAEPPSQQELLAHYGGRVARWWIPDDVVFVDQLPHTATGKLRKRSLRERYANHVWPQGDGEGGAAGEPGLS